MYKYLLVLTQLQIVCCNFSVSTTAPSGKNDIVSKLKPTSALYITMLSPGSLSNPVVPWSVYFPVRGNSDKTTYSHQSSHQPYP
jgi:hypothetical protein